MWGFYAAKTREDIPKKDPMGDALVGKYFHPYLTYNARIDKEFHGTFSMKFNENNPYTYKSQYLKDITLTGDKNSKVIGNSMDNNITGNSGENTVVFTGKYSEYTITNKNEIVTIKDNIPNRDGIDTIKNVEYLQFKDKKISLKDAGVL